MPKNGSHNFQLSRVERRKLQLLSVCIALGINQKFMLGEEILLDIPELLEENPTRFPYLKGSKIYFASAEGEVR